MNSEILSKLTETYKKSLIELDSIIEFPTYSESIIHNPELKEKVENKFETIKEGIVDKKCGWLPNKCCLFYWIMPLNIPMKMEQ